MAASSSHGTAIAVDAANSSDGTVRRMRIGMNLSVVIDWSREWVFVDGFKSSRPWIAQRAESAQPWDTGETIETDAKGWPILKKGQAAATLMFRDLEGHYPGGIYTLSYEGRGVVSMGLDAKSMKRLAVNRFGVLVEPSNGGVLLRITESDPQDPIRNIRFIMPGFNDADSPFHPLFMDRLRPFSVIRFMNWQRTNNSKVVKWSDRTTMDCARQSDVGGVAVEYMIQLCNALDVEPWFCMPHGADEDYVRHFAEIVHRDLKPGLRIYVEWSNETWNALFEQSQMVRAAAKARGVEFTTVIAEHALRDWKIWRDVFKDDPTRIIRVASGQTHSPWVAQKLATALGGEFDAISCAGYFDPRKDYEADFDEHTTAKETLEATARYMREKRIPLMRQHAELAKQWSEKLGRKISFVAYEGGPGYATMGRKPAYLQAYFDAQRDPMMADLYREMLDAFADMGGDVFMSFVYVAGNNHIGCWGHLEYQDQPLSEAPKYKALLDYINRTKEPESTIGEHKQTVTRPS